MDFSVKSSLILSLLFVSSIAGATESSLALNVTNIAIDNTEKKYPDHVFCFSKDWKETSPGIQLKIESLHVSAANAVVRTYGSDANLCFDPAKLTPVQQVSFDEIFTLLRTESDDQLEFTVDDVSPTINPGPVPTPTNPPVFTPPAPLRVVGPHALATPTPAFPSLGQVMLRNEDKPFGRKLLRATGFMQGTQLVSFGVLLALPKSFTKWDKSDLSIFKSHMHRAWTKPPVWDRDQWYINYIGHPAAGAIYYGMIRSQGGTPLQSFLYSTSQSLFWEYVVEAGAEQPSIQDLLFTSTIGSVWGELGHRATLRMTRGGFNFWEKATIILINPSYPLNNGFKVKRRPPVPALAR